MKKLSCLIVVLTVMTFPTVIMGAELVTNGGFETGDFTGWTVWNEPGSGGDFYVYSGTTSPSSASIVPAPPEGTYAALTDQSYDPSNPGPLDGTHIIFQDVLLPEAALINFSAIVYAENRGPLYINHGLYRGSVASQFMRVDIMKPSASLQSQELEDILINLFITEEGDPLSYPYENLSANLTPYAGQEIRIRIAQCNNQGSFQGGVDAVSIETSSSASIPTLSEWGMIIFALLTVVTALVVLRRRNMSA
ncbi:MAG TPA: IPTL-CTERM sorting domain-containing protein [Alphaproteobacteria bacterium]|nr:IPTL-CTERM sorting domain-containing protein [Alphaproteobacteria bacterium]